ncbi:ATP-binding protein [Sphingomonas donggukensis]|uniref:histidine kinase n=1 Tax=Sphingomonas donggukensis TaxID=2949093 RepID=A0ABY4TWV4_9SPHN|nr:ATP-binding protein [Sphingomonas donggukensis]URW76883.1 ATP-binding protein [Sphingomonas donggukensis]
MSDRGLTNSVDWVRARWRTITMVIVAVLGAAVLTALVTALGASNRARDRALSLQSHSFEVMILTRSLAGTIAKAEATLGRFVISGDKAIGRRFQDGWTQAGQQIDRLDVLARDNDMQRARVDALRTAYRVRGDQLSLIALSTNYRKNDQALARYYAASDDQALKDIDRLLQGFIDTERLLLSRRTADAQATIERSNTAAKVFAGFGIAILLGAIALGWLTVRAQTDRAIAAAEADSERQRAEDLEAAVVAATDELHAEAREREAAEAQLRQIQKLDAVGQLTGGIAHDFNNMLAVVLGGIELAKRRHAEGSDEVGRHLDSAAEGANRASALTRRLLAFARAEPLLPQAVEARTLIDGMSDLIDRTLGDAIRVETVHDSAGWHVWVDRHGLENAILNLAVNARDAMDGRGALTIATGTTTLGDGSVGQCVAGDYVTIAVSDTGCGMTADVIERVYEPFFTTKPVGKGTGLGLSQIFGFVQQTGGEIGIASQPGAGTTVTLYLPRHAAAPPAAEPTALPDAALPHAATRSLDILVVEDDLRVLSATIDVLVDLGHRPLPCPDPLTVEEVVAGAAAIDLVISDVLMPGRTGPEVIAAIAPRLPDAAVLYVTGFAGEAAEHDDFGGRVVLRKPYTIAALEVAIDKAMAARDAAPARRSAA